jgi:hypothetical protein
VGFLNLCIEELKNGWEWEILHLMALESVFEVWDGCSENYTDGRLFFTRKPSQSSYSCIIRELTLDYLIPCRNYSKQYVVPKHYILIPEDSLLKEPTTFSFKLSTTPTPVPFSL